MISDCEVKSVQDDGSVSTISRTRRVSVYRKNSLSQINHRVIISYFVGVCMNIVAALATVVAWAVGFATTQGDPLATDRLIAALMDGAALVPTGLGDGLPSPQVSFVADPFMTWAMPALTDSGSLTVDNAVAGPASGVPGARTTSCGIPRHKLAAARPRTRHLSVRPAVPEDYAPEGRRPFIGVKAGGHSIGIRQASQAA